MEGVGGASVQGADFEGCVEEETGVQGYRKLGEGKIWAGRGESRSSKRFWVMTEDCETVGSTRVLSVFEGNWKYPREEDDPSFYHLPALIACLMNSRSIN